MPERAPNDVSTVRTPEGSIGAVAHSNVPNRPIPLATALPLFTTFIVVAVLITALILTWVTLTRTALENAQERVDRAAQQLKVVLDNSTRAMNTRGRVLARDTLIMRALRQGVPNDPNERQLLRSSLLRINPPNDTVGYVELWSADGRRLDTIVQDLARPLMRRKPEIDDGAVSSATQFGMPTLIDTDSVQLSHLSNCDGAACYWIVMPIMHGDSALGYVASYRRIVRNPGAERTIHGLAGGTIEIFFRNDDNSMWTSVFGEIRRPPDISTDRKHRSRPGIGEVLWGEYEIAGTPWEMVTEVPRQEVLAGPRQSVRLLATLSLLLTVGGAVVAWILGRRLVSPLISVTDAARKIADGNFDIRVPKTGTEEMVTLAASFNHMAAQVGASLKAVEAASRAKSDFLATMSHELRTPLNAIGGYVEIMELGLRGPITELQRHDLSRIRQSQAHLLSLINAVLDLNRFERGQVSYELAPMPLAPFLTGLDALIAPQAAAKALTFVHTPTAADLCVVADREKLRQVVLNLLSNAIRYTPAGGQISLGATQVTPETIAISVSDTGPGIPSERQDEIFEPFVQLDRSLTTSREGVGLGLAISRDLARGMGGELRVESAPGQGARFIVELPCGDFSEALPLVVTGEMHAQRPAPLRA